MAARFSSRTLFSSALITLAVAFAWPTLSCAPEETSSRAASHSLMADASQAEKNKAERCKKADGTRVPRDCPDGGERLPQDKRSPLERIPPLAPLVA